MATKTQAINGLVKYIDTEMLPKIDGVQKWIFGAAVSMAMNNASQIMDKVISHPAVKLLGVVDENGDIDLETLHKEFSKQAAKGAVDIAIPFVGNMTVNQTDVEKLYRYIKEAQV